MRLRAYQRDGVDFLVGRVGALLADEMGLGKTVQAIAAVGLLTQLSGFIKTLIVAPSALQTNWADEIARWLPSFPCMVLTGDQEDRLAAYKLPVALQLASYEQIRSDATAMRSQDIYDLVILDEAQRIKNTDSLTALACRMIPRRRAWALSGTPVENRVEDLVAIVRFIAPDLQLDVHAGRLNTRQVESLVLRRRIRDVVPELPQVIDRTIRVDLTRAQQRAYEAARASAREIARDAASSGNTLLAQITKLKLICNYDCHTDSSAKLEVLLDIIEASKASSKKVIVFSQYVDTLTWLSEKIPADTFIYHGQMTADSRNRVISEFRICGFAVLLVSLKAGGVGLNLQFASTVVLFDRWWNPATESQAVSRVLRIGQSEPVSIYRFITVSTIEEQIEIILDSKGVIFDETVNSLAERSDKSKASLRSLILNS